MWVRVRDDSKRGNLVSFSTHFPTPAMPLCTDEHRRQLDGTATVTENVSSAPSAPLALTNYLVPKKLAGLIPE